MDLASIVSSIQNGTKAFFDAEGFVKDRLKKADILVFNDYNFENEFTQKPRDHDIIVTNPEFYSKLVREGVFQLKGVSLPLGEMYMQGIWHTPNLREFFLHAMSTKLETNTFDPGKLIREIRQKIEPRSFRRRREKQLAEEHYDAGTKVLDDMLPDRYRMYTCADFRSEEISQISDLVSRLDLAQDDKLENLARKLDLEPGMTVVDIGCGEGFFGAYLSHSRPGVKYVGITNSEEHARKARQAHKDNKDIDIVVSDFRDYKGRADRVIVIGSSEHFGPKGYPEFLKKSYEILRNDGDILLIHGIASNKEEWSGDPWIEKEVFPNSVLLSQERIAREAEKVGGKENIGFVIEDLENIGPQYAPTLMAWYEMNQQNEFFKSLPQSEKRKWDFYLLSCSVGFQVRKLQLHQYVLTKNGREEGYSRPILRYQESNI